MDALVVPEMPSGWITVHDAEVPKKSRPRPVRVRASAIYSIRPYAEGLARCVLGIGGRAYIHVEETEDEIFTKIAESGGDA